MITVSHSPHWLNFQPVSALTSDNKPAVRCEMGGQDNIYKYLSQFTAESSDIDRQTVFYFSISYRSKWSFTYISHLYILILCT